MEGWAASLWQKNGKEGLSLQFDSFNDLMLFVGVARRLAHYPDFAVAPPAGCADTDLFTDISALLYLYRPCDLERDLQDRLATEILQHAGYACTGSEQCLMQLIERLRAYDEFPHEIGLFLSYPPEDVKGFIEHHAADFKYAGLWKVYGDERQARQTFAKYKKCTQVYCERWQSGSGLDKLAVADR